MQSLGQTPPLVDHLNHLLTGTIIRLIPMLVYQDHSASAYRVLIGTILSFRLTDYLPNAVIAEAVCFHQAVDALSSSIPKANLLVAQLQLPPGTVALSPSSPFFRSLRDIEFPSLDILLNLAEEMGW